MRNEESPNDARHRGARFDELRAQSAAQRGSTDPFREAHQPHGRQAEAQRDGSSFNTRQVKAIQHGRPIFVLSVSFHKQEHGLAHQTTMPKVP